MTRLLGLTPGTRIVDPATGMLTGDGFRLFQFIVSSLNGGEDVVTVDGVQTLTNKTIDGDSNTLQDIATASLKTRTGVIARVVTGQAGLSGNLAQWNGDGDAVDSGISSASVLQTGDIGVNVQPYDPQLDVWAAKTAPSGAVVGTNDAQILTNKIIDAGDNFISDLEVGNLAASAVVTAADTIEANDNDSTLPTSAAVKDYADSRSLVGTWTPTLTGVANVDATTALLCHYMRIDTQVMCWGAFQVDATAAADTQTQVRMSLPIASDFADALECAGTFANSTPRTGTVTGDVANNEALLTYRSGTTANTGFYFVFGYEIK